MRFLGETLGEGLMIWVLQCRGMGRHSTQLLHRRLSAAVRGMVMPVRVCLKVVGMSVYWCSMQRFSSTRNNLHIESQRNEANRSYPTASLLAGLPSRAPAAGREVSPARLHRGVIFHPYPSTVLHHFVILSLPSTTCSVRVLYARSCSD